MAKKPSTSTMKHFFSSKAELTTALNRSIESRYTDAYLAKMAKRWGIPVDQVEPALRTAQRSAVDEVAKQAMKGRSKLAVGELKKYEKGLSKQIHDTLDKKYTKLGTMPAGAGAKKPPHPRVVAKTKAAKAAAKAVPKGAAAQNPLKYAAGRASRAVPPPGDAVQKAVDASKATAGAVPVDRVGPSSTYMSGLPRTTTTSPLRQMAGPGSGPPVAGPADLGVGPTMRTGQPKGWIPPVEGAEDVAGKTYLKGASSKGVEARVPTKGGNIKSLVKKIRRSPESLKRLASVPKGSPYGGPMKAVTAKQWISRAGLRGSTNLEWLTKKIGKSGVVMLGVMLAHEATKKIAIEPWQLGKMLEVQEGQAASQEAAVKGTIRDEAARALTGQMQQQATTAQQAAMQMMMQHPTLQVPQTGEAPVTGVPFRTAI